MRRVRIVEARSKRRLLEEAGVAESVLDRFLGLMGRRGLPSSTGLVLPRCSSIHMFFMRFPIDVAYLDKARRVKKIVEALRPWRMSWCPGADSVIEAASGWKAQVGLTVGMELEFEELERTQR